MLSIGVIAAILFECAAKLIRSYLTDIAGKKADLIISSALRRVMAVKCLTGRHPQVHTQTICGNMSLSGSL